jgi:hypothetical protein
MTGQLLRRIAAIVVALMAGAGAVKVWFYGRVSPQHVIVLRDVAPMNDAVILLTALGVVLIDGLIGLATLACWRAFR